MARTSARLELLDVAGRRLMTREVGSLGAGEHIVDIGAPSLTPGVYFLRLVQQDRSTFGRAIIVR